MSRLHLAALAIASFVFCAVVSLSPAARAGDTINNPHDLDSCGDINHAAAMTDPNDVNFGNAPQKDCEKLCSQAVKDAASCQTDFWSDQKKYGEAACEIDENTSASIKACKKDYGDFIKAQKDAVKSIRGANESVCEAWGDACAAANCLPL